jgi:IS1 family transposase
MTFSLFALGFGGTRGHPVACSTIDLANWLRSARFGCLGLIMMPHLRNATGRSAFSNSRAATRLSLSRIHVAIGRPACSAASRNACFSDSVTRSSMYSSKGFFVLGRPSFGTALLYQQKQGERKIFLDMTGFCGYTIDMNKLNREKQAQVLKSLIEGNSIRATVRLTGAAKDTVTKLLVAAGTACADYQNRVLRGLKCKLIQCDEIWAFVYAKEKNVPADKKGQFGFGDVWTWVAIDAQTKLVPCFRLGNRDARNAEAFIDDLASRLGNRVQLTTDGLKVYLEAVEGAFGADVDFAQLIKIYGATQEEARYSPAECIGCHTIAITGRPKPQHISTSYVERQNLTMRMCMRRFTRLTNAFSKKVDNLFYSLALYFMYYNFCRVHQTLRVTPAMEAGIADHIWTIEEMLDRLAAKDEADRAA